jgi:hypothetical protein
MCCRLTTAGVIGLFFFYEKQWYIICTLTCCATSIWWILSHVGWYTQQKWRVLVRLIGFISTLVTLSLLITLKYRHYSAIADLHTLHSTVAHALGFSISTSRLLATALSTETSTEITRSITHKIFQSHFTSSQANLLYSSVLLVPLRSVRVIPPLLFLSTYLLRNSAHFYRRGTDSASQ